MHTTCATTVARRWYAIISPQFSHYHFCNRQLQGVYNGDGGSLDQKLSNGNLSTYRFPHTLPSASDGVTSLNTREH